MIWNLLFKGVNEALVIVMYINILVIKATSNIKNNLRDFI